MVNGFSRFEGLFGGSNKKKERTLAVEEMARKESWVLPEPNSEPDILDAALFPAPSFIRPTSMQMRPRSPIVQQECCPLTGKERSRSLPLQHQLRRQFSTYSTETKITRRVPTSAVCQPVSRNSEDRSSKAATPTPSTYRFPEDALFRPEGTDCSSVDLSPRAQARSTSPRIDSQSFSGNDFLGWSPKTTSEPFMPRELRYEHRESTVIPMNEVTASRLLPSPMPAPTHQPPPVPLEEARPQPARAASTRDRPASRKSESKLSLFPKQYAPFQPVNLQLHSPPPSDSEEDGPRVAKNRSKSWATGAHRTSVVKSPPMSSSFRSAPSSARTRHNKNQSLASLPGQSPQNSNYSTDHTIARKARLRLSQSADALSPFASNMAHEQVLSQPTFDDFMALSDDDLLEEMPSRGDESLAVAPSSKRNNTSERRRPAPVAALESMDQHSTMTLVSGELTPPETPTDSQFLALPPPASTSSHLGALMAAEIAQTYGFDLVYVVSLWPEEGGSSLDPCRRTAADTPQAAPSGDLPAVTKGSKMTGRFLAAYGLDQVPAPFPLDIKAHVPALKSRTWREWRDPEAAFDAISMGWGHSFLSEQLGTSSSAGSSGSLSGEMMHRGIVFAGFSKRSKPSAVPVNASPERALILDGLYSNVKILVDTILEQL